ncbi:MAG: hypothetical protein AAGI25_08835 [Bacteroidota bacterium]
MHFVEQGVLLTNEYGDIGENFYTSIENTYSSALDSMSKNRVLNKFEVRAYKVVTDMKDL